MKNGWTKALAQKDEEIAELKAFKQAVENGRCSECPFLGEAQNQYEQIATLKAEVERLREALSNILNTIHGEGIHIAALKKQVAALREDYNRTVRGAYSQSSTKGGHR